MELLLVLPVLLLAIASHEFAHAYAAMKQGDYTAYDLGRVSLNPIRHIDPIGTIVVPLLLWVMKAGFIFGWARPVPVDPRNYRNYRRGDIIVSLAGIAANLILAILSAAVFLIAIPLGRAIPSIAPTLEIMVRMAEYGILINMILALFNLIPIPPLDGSRVVYHILPARLKAPYQELGRYGIFLLLALVFLLPGGLRFIFTPIIWVLGLLRDLAGVA